MPWAKDPASWSPARDVLIQPDEVHVWCAFLHTANAEALSFFLDKNEQSRADSFHFLKDKQHFASTRGLLRVLLGNYLGVAPGELRFSCNAYGKPSLADTVNGSGLRFNVSHSNDIALYAITAGREVGVDIEYVRPMDPADLVPEQFFSPREVAELRSLPTHLQQTAFYTCWTRKEAYIKAVGKGLSLGLDQFDVSFRPGEPAALLRVSGDAQEAARWALREITPAPDYVGALAVEGHDWRLQCWQWQG